MDETETGRRLEETGRRLEDIGRGWEGIGVSLVTGSLPGGLFLFGGFGAVNDRGIA